MRHQGPSWRLPTLELAWESGPLLTNVVTFGALVGSFRNDDRSGPSAASNLKIRDEWRFSFFSFGLPRASVA